MKEARNKRINTEQILAVSGRTKTNHTNKLETVC